MFICSTMSNLNNFKPQQLQSQKRVQNEKKKQNRRPEPRKQTKDPTLFPLFSALCDFFLKFFGLHQLIPPSFCNTMDVKKLQRVPPFTFFGTVTPFKNLVLKNFSGNFFMSPKGPPSFFFHFLQPAGVSQSPKGPPFSILSLRYGADFGRSRLVFCSFLEVLLL